MSDTMSQARKPTKLCGLVVARTRPNECVDIGSLGKFITSSVPNLNSFN